MTVFEQETFECLYDRNSGRIFSDLEFRRCRFESCGISITRKLRLRSIVRNVKLIDCKASGCTVDTAIVEDVVVDGLDTYKWLTTWGAVFKHVTLKGKIGDVVINPIIAPGVATPEEQQAFDEANVAYYSHVDWALDISQGIFSDLSIRNVPASLIRRDPASQIVVKREKALQGKWHDLDLAETYWPIVIEQMLKWGYPDAVLVAPKASPEYKALLDGLKMLRDAGVAEAD